MLRFLLLRPIAVGASVVVVLALSVLAWRALPVSLMPELEVPYISIAVKYPGHAPAEIEQNFLSPLREGMLSLNGLRNMESQAHSESGTVRLEFNHGSRIDLAYIEVNEKIDRLSQFFPRDADRPFSLALGCLGYPGNKHSNYSQE